MTETAGLDPEHPTEDGVFGSGTEPAPESTDADELELDLPSRERTGDDEVDAALDLVDGARGSSLGHHLTAAESAQDALQQRLADTGE